MPKPLLICDTDVLATALWHERYVGESAERILERAAAHQPALYILTGDEIPFAQDGLRDAEQIRHQMQERFRGVLALQPEPWIEVRGSVTERIRTTCRYVDQLQRFPT
ncbi:AAA family ATPase [uncultured Amnibacterium sp.]|uniref:AAA family ATPase n=1 Tax=uncultured Amnibacterium sp. TaxID=1631851 RepID=UPI0035CB9594